MNFYKCNNFSNLNDTKLNEILNTCQDINLEYRKDLSMDKNIKFGTEIEFLIKNNSYEKIKDYIESYSNWNLEDEFNCWEFETDYKPLEISSSILKNNRIDLLRLKNVFNYLYINDAKLNLSCGNHIHYDISILKNKYKYYERFLKFFSVYEPIIYMFSCGELNILRNSVYTHAKPIGKDCFITLQDNYKKNIRYLKTKYCQKDRAIRLSAFDTIEIRTPMGTTNPAINQNYILFFYKIFEYITSRNYDENKINNKFNMIKDRREIFYEYNKISTKDVLELADILYDNNLDKIYFLKQCLKLYKKTDYKSKIL